MNADYPVCLCMYLGERSLHGKLQRHCSMWKLDQDDASPGPMHNSTGRDKSSLSMHSVCMSMTVRSMSCKKPKAEASKWRDGAKAPECFARREKTRVPKKNQKKKGTKRPTHLDARAAHVYHVAWHCACETHFSWPDPGGAPVRW